MRGESAGKAQEAEDDILDAFAHVALASRFDFVGLLARETEQHGHVMGAKRP